MSNNTRFFIGVDNGVTGSIAIIKYSPEGLFLNYFKTPTVVQQNYQKKKTNITRINAPMLIDIFRKAIPKGSTVHVMIERPMVNPSRFTASLSGIRCLEAMLTIVEALKYSFEFVDSKEWQKSLLPKGCVGEHLKTASLDIGQRKYPGRLISGHPDADGLLIAHYLMLKYK